jgi:hypothetical protein
MIKSFPRLFTAALWLLFSLHLPAVFAAVEKTGLEGLEWRLIGPWRGEHVAMPDL